MNTSRKHVPDMPLNIAIIEDDPILCDELLEFFDGADDINCVLVVESVPKFQRFYRDFMDIHVLLLDINLPKVSGADGIPQLRKLLPNAEIIMHTVVNDYDTIFKCICLGATGYLLKDGNLNKLRETLLEIRDTGGSALSPSVARRILAYFQPQAKRNLQEETLSEQELTISRLLVDGLSYQEVADAVGISLNGVRYHVKNIYKKLHINSKGALLKRFRAGWFGG
ncbi:MAG: response regulator transcription factor [Saprospiraceae bacterium]|jgi:DNA-binding NarL/FixJ family response regulator